MKCTDCKNLKQTKSTMHGNMSCCSKDNPAFDQPVLLGDELIEDCEDFQEKLLLLEFACEKVARAADETGITTEQAFKFIENLNGLLKV